MARFHFHQHNGKSYPDEDGTELPGMEAARATALRALTELVHEAASEFWRTGEWQMTVTDEQGLTLFCLSLSATDAPAAGGFTNLHREDGKAADAG